MSTLIANDHLLSSVLEGLSDPAVLVDPGRRILASNRAFRARFSAGEDPRGCFCYEMTHGRCRRCTEDEVGRCPLDSRGVERTLHVHSHCMGESYEEVFAHPVEDGRGQLSAFLLVTHPLSCSLQLVGHSRAFVRMMALVDHAASIDAPVLLRGEAGSGRLCVARVMHALSSRSRGPFVVAECAVTSERTLAEEILGTESRPQNGTNGRPCLVESAQGGTLLLHGIDEMPTALMPRIFDLVGKGVYERVGSDRPRRADVRWLMICRRERELKAARALPDLLRISIPALRSRRQDIPILAERMIQKYGDGCVSRISKDALLLLRRHPFPGNLRELETLIERACLLADGEELRTEHFPSLDQQLH